MLSISSFIQNNAARGLIVGLLSFCLLAPLSLTGFFEVLDNRVLDRFYQWRPLDAVPPADLLVVGIDEASFQELRMPWPWPRRVHASLIDRLTSAGARLIVFDVLFVEPSTPEDDRLMAEAMQRAGNVILAETVDTADDPYFTRKILVRPFQLFREAAKDSALAMIVPDVDGVVRHFQTLLYGVETLSSAVVKNLRTESPPPAPSGGSGLIDYAGPPRTLKTVSYYQVIDPEKELPANLIRGRIVLVGRMLQASATPQSQADTFYSPYFSSSGQLISGVEIHGNVIHTLLGGSWGREAPPIPRLAAGAAVLLMCGVFLARLGLIRGTAAAIAAAIFLVGTSFALFVFRNIWFPPALSVLGLALVHSGNILLRYFVKLREERWLKNAFGRYVSPIVVESITANREKLQLGGEEVEATVLFSDIAGFTTFSEGMSPRDLIMLLNEYFTPMTRIVLDSQGTLDKYIGDAIMAVWGVPLALPGHPRCACEAAIRMLEKLAELRDGWQMRGLPRISARIGIHTGPVLAGNVGSRDRFNYTVMGDTVNLASRLETVNKIYGTSALLSEDTQRQAGEAFLTREIDRIRVKGRSTPIAIYELLGLRREDPEPAWLQAFASGLAAYRSRDWDLAKAHFEKTLFLSPGDTSSLVYLERCRRFKEMPPPADWDGSFTQTSK